MGPKQSKNELPSSVKQKVLKLFSLIDVDGSKTIDREETLKFWSSSFAKVNAIALFSQVDKNNDGTIQLEEWVDFWTNVFLAGYTEEEINFELDNLIDRKPWVQFRTCENNKSLKKKDSLKEKGKI